MLPVLATLLEKKIGAPAAVREHLGNGCPAPADGGKCIYEVDGDTLRFCYADGARPTEFKTTEANPDLRLYVWQRAKADGGGQPPK